MKIPVVGIVMGSDSDLEIMSKACKIMDEFKIPYECSIVSAHRTPNRLYSYADEAIRKGLKVIHSPMYLDVQVATRTLEYGQAHY